MANHPYKKKWGQNFIKDNNFIMKIINIIDPKKDDKIIEIGPGKGALTNYLADNVKNLVAVEIDPLLCSALENDFNGNVKIINQDILNLELNNFSDYNKIVGNLPYYITTPIN